MKAPIQSRGKRRRLEIEYLQDVQGMNRRVTLMLKNVLRRIGCLLLRAYELMHAYPNSDRYYH